MKLKLDKNNRKVLLTGDCRGILKQLPAKSIQCVVTSPPYWGLRDYGLEPLVWGVDGCKHIWEKESYQRRSNDGGEEDRKQTTNMGAVGRDKPIHHAFCQLCNAWRGSLGLEPTPELYVQHLVEIFRDVKRVLRDDGTVWINLGDSYAANRGSGSKSIGEKQATNVGANLERLIVPPGLKPKDLIGIPWKIAFALQADGAADFKAVQTLERVMSEIQNEYEGQPIPKKVLNALKRLDEEWREAKGDSWYLRSDIIWSKPNPMPESCTDRPTKAHEYVFLLSKKAKYFYDADAVREEGTESTIERDKYDRNEPRSAHFRHGTGYMVQKANTETKGGRNKRTVWTIATQSFPEAHFAVFPEKLVEPCILAGTSEKGCCPECGSPWERVVDKNITNAKGRDFVNRGDDSRGRKLRTGDSESKTIGWQPTCKHKHKPIPCTVLDPFIGSGTTILVALRNNCFCIGIDLSPKYIKMAKRRTKRVQSKLLRLG